MYRINVITDGKYHNVIPGYRYCLRKKDAFRLIDDFFEANCNFEVEKFIRIHSTVFCWSNCDEEDKVFQYYDSFSQ